MTALADFQQFVVDAEAGTQFAAWRKANPNDYGRWSAIRDLILQGRAVPTLPTMQTPHGRELIDAAKLYLDQAPTPPTPASGWADAIAYTKTPRAFTASREVAVTDQGSLQLAISGLKAGDHVLATKPFTMKSEIQISKKLTAPAKIELPGVSWLGFPKNPDGTLSAPGLVPLYFIASENVWLYLDDMTNPGGAGAVDMFNVKDCVLYVNRIHDTGGDGVSLVTNAGPIESCDIYLADVSNWFMDITGDPHLEKGTGGHACQFGDGSSYAAGNRFAMYAHDGPHGSALQYGSYPAGGIQSNQIYLKAERLTMASTIQIAGSALQLWGGSPIGADVQYLEATDLQGYAVSCDGEYNADFSGVVVKYGRSTNTRKNPKWTAPTWNPGPTYQDVSGS